MSEETEVKGIEWLKDEILTDMRYLEGNRDIQQLDIKYQTLREVAQKINSLDEPEVLSQEWIDENVDYADVRGGTQAFIHVGDLQNLLVPKQELPVIPKFVADFIESYDGDFYSLLYDADNISSDASLVTEEYYELGNWLSVNSDELLQAVANGYEVEEEQKYYVLDTEDIPMLVKSYGAVNRANTHLSIHEKGRNTEHYQLTEQEIKDYDERYFAFSVKVEELEG